MELGSSLSTPVAGPNIGTHLTLQCSLKRRALLCTFESSIRAGNFILVSYCRQYFDIRSGQRVDVASSSHVEKDSPANDLGNVGFQSPPAIIAAIDKLADPSSVVAFRSSGFIKNKITFPLDNLPNAALFDGIYIRWGAQG